MAVKSATTGRRLALARYLTSGRHPLVARVLARVGPATFLAYVVQAGPAALAFNVASLGLGYLMPRLAGLSRHQSKAIALEIGLHNAALAIFIALTVMRNNEMTVAPVVYGVLMFATGGLFSLWLARSE